MNGRTMGRYEGKDHVSRRSGSPQRTMPQTGMVGAGPVVRRERTDVCVGVVSIMGCSGFEVTDKF